MNWMILENGTWIVNLDQVQSVKIAEDQKSAKVYFTGGYKTVEGEEEVLNLIGALSRRK